MGRGSVYIMALLGAIICVVGSVVLKMYAELAIEKELEEEHMEKREFYLSIADEEAFDKLRHSAVRDPEFIEVLNSSGIDIDDIDSDYITSITDSYINLTLPNGNFISIGELNDQFVWRIWREDEDKGEVEA